MDRVAAQGEVPHYQQQPQQGSNVLHDTQRIHDKQHLKVDITYI